MLVVMVIFLLATIVVYFIVFHDLLTYGERINKMNENTPFELMDIDKDGDVVSPSINRFEEQKKHYINVLEAFFGGK